MTTWTDEDALRLDISMALSKIKTKPRGDRDDVYRKMVAEQIVAHLKLSNWQFVKGTPAPHHALETVGECGRRLRPAPFCVRSGTSFPYPAFEAKAAPFPPITPLGRLYGKHDGEARCNNPGFFVITSEAEAIS